MNALRKITLTGHLTQADKAASDYAYILFDLPQPARRLTVRYSYSAAMSSNRSEGGNVIDIGLFDPAGADFPGGAGFRGWSGSARSEFTITPDNATPGYTPGPLPAGPYQVILGLYRIWPAGADYEIHIEAEMEDQKFDFSEKSAFSIRENPSQPCKSVSVASEWLRGDLQSHTFHSDATGSPQQLLAKAKGLGLDFLAVTDHNNTSHHRALAALDDGALLLIPGQEVTTYYGHMNVWGTGRWCDFRCRTADDIRAIIELAHSQGALCSINHPKTGGPAWEYGFDLPVDALEVWQGPWPYRNAESLALWDRLLAGGWRVPVVGGSDYHCPGGEETNLLRLGQPTTWVQATERSVAGVLGAIQRGRVCISARADGPRLEIGARSAEGAAEMGGALSVAAGAPVEVTTTIWGGNGLRLRLVVDGKAAFEQGVDDDEARIVASVLPQRYLRAELVGDCPPALLPPQAPPGIDLRDWCWALTNPIYCGKIEDTDLHG